MTFSIIIPVYNVAPYLRECLDSVLAQTYTDWEAICVDDGSTDGSGAILDEYAEKVRRSRPEVMGGGEGQDSRSRSRTTNSQLPTIRVIHQENKGVSAARNAALDVAQGEWIGFLDGDDLFTPWYLYCLSQRISSLGVEWVRINGVLNIDRPVPMACSPCSFNIIRSPEVTPFLWQDITKIDGGFGWLNWFRRDFVGEHRFDDGVRFGEDTIFLLRLIERCGSVAVADMSGYRYRYDRADSASNAIHYSDVFPLLAETVSIASAWRHNNSPDIDRQRQSAAFLAEKTFKRVTRTARGVTFAQCFTMARILRELKSQGVVCFEHVRRSEKVAWRVFLYSGLMIGYAIIKWTWFDKIVNAASLLRIKR